VVCATGFAAMTGSFDKIRIVGRNGLTLSEKWRAGPRAYFGIASVGFPNLFMITGPGSPSVLASMIQAIEQHVDWLADCRSYAGRRVMKSLGMVLLGAAAMREGNCLRRSRRCRPTGRIGMIEAGG
jgi:cation diffusion facilitator CzcD-associated flavoprotein CzcO